MGKGKLAEPTPCRVRDDVGNHQGVSLDGVGPPECVRGAEGNCVNHRPVLSGKVRAGPIPQTTASMVNLQNGTAAPLAQSTKQATDVVEHAVQSVSSCEGLENGLFAVYRGITPFYASRRDF